MTGRVLSTGQTVTAGEAGLGGSVVEHIGAAPGFVMSPPSRPPGLHVKVYFFLQQLHAPPWQETCEEADLACCHGVSGLSRDEEAQGAAAVTSHLKPVLFPNGNPFAGLAEIICVVNV